MSKPTTAKQHLDAAVGFIAIAEAADSSSVAYRKAAEEIEAAMKADPTLTKQSVAQQIGKGPMYVGRLLQALAIARDSGEFRVDWQSGSNKRADIASKVPTRHDDRVEMATTLLADPEVVETILNQPSQVQRQIENTVHEKETQRKKKAKQESQQAREDKALPLPAYMATMVVKMNEWSAGLAGLYEYLDELPPGPGRDLVLAAVSELERQARRWREVLTHSDRPELTVIEGKKSA